MALSKNVVEPVVIVAIFTVGTLASRRTTRHRHGDVEGCHDDDHQVKTAPSNIVFHLLARFFTKFPFLEEIWYWLLTYWIYQLLRAFSARMIASNEDIFLTARHHALQILTFEHTLHLDVELSFQKYILTRCPGIVPFLAYVYYAHITVGVAFLAYGFTCCPREAYIRVRRTLALDNAIAFTILTLWRCAPPRLLPEEYGFVDVLHGGIVTGGDTAWTNNRFQLTIAAMPSLHFGTSLLLGIWLSRFSPHWPVRLLAPLWPAAMLPTIVATGNHFLADAAVGAAIPCIGWRFSELMSHLTVLQDWMFSPLRRRMGFHAGKSMVD